MIAETLEGVRASKESLRIVAICGAGGELAERCPSGQREQTVNLPALPTKVRILPSPPLLERNLGLRGLK